MLAKTILIVRENFQGVCENFGNSGGERGRVNFGGRFWKIKRKGGVIRQIPSVGGGGGYFLELHNIIKTHIFLGLPSTHEE